MKYSAFQTEAEYVLPPGTQLKVLEKTKKGNLNVIVLEEADASRLVK